MSGWQPQQYDPGQHQQRLAQPQERREQPYQPFHGYQEEKPTYPPTRHAPPRTRQNSALLYAGIALIAGLGTGGAAGYLLHGGGNAASPSAPGTASAPTGASAAPDTAAAAKSAAASFFALYSAGQWPSAWQYLTAADKAKAPLSVYDQVHLGCPSKSAELAYTIKGVTMAGQTAVITYSLSGVAGAIGSATMPATWTPAGWTVSPDMSVYGHGSVKADIAYAKAAGDCG